MTNPSELMAQAESYAKTDVANRGPRHAEVAPTNPSDTRDSELAVKLRDFAEHLGPAADMYADEIKALCEAADTIDRLSYLLATTEKDATDWIDARLASARREAVGVIAGMGLTLLKEGYSATVWPTTVADIQDDTKHPLFLASPREGHVEVPVERSTADDLTYLLECVSAHADKFPVPTHMTALVARIRAALPHNQGETKP